MIAAIELLVVWMTLAIPAALIGLPYTLLRGDISFLYRWAIWIIRVGLRVAAIKVEVGGRENLAPKQPYLFLSNHVSNLDPPVLLSVLPERVAVFIKRSLMKLPALGYAMSYADFIPVGRTGDRESARESVKHAARVLASGTGIVSFVEGTRSPDGRMLPFKRGPFYLAMQAGIPVVPVSIHGTESMMPKGSLKVRPGTPTVVFHTPLSPRDFSSREELMVAVRLAIESGLPQWMWQEKTTV